MSVEPETKQAEPKAGELLADTDKDLVGSSVMISYSRKGCTQRHTAAPRPLPSVGTAQQGRADAADDVASAP